MFTWTPSAFVASPTNDVLGKFLTFSPQGDNIPRSNRYWYHKILCGADNKTRGTPVHKSLLRRQVLLLLELESADSVKYWS